MEIMVNRPILVSLRIVNVFHVGHIKYISGDFDLRFVSQSWIIFSKINKNPVIYRNKYNLNLTAFYATKVCSNNNDNDDLLVQKCFGLRLFDTFSLQVVNGKCTSKPNSMIV